MTPHTSGRRGGAAAHGVLALGALALVAGLAWFVVPALHQGAAENPVVAAEPAPGQEDGLVAQLVSAFLQQGHLTKPKLDAELSRRFCQRYLTTLDPSKGYFLKSDIDEFKQQQDQLCAQVQKGDVSFAHKVFDRLLQRIADRQALIAAQVNAKHDYTVQEYLETDPAKAEYVQTDAELTERWRKRVKLDLLLLRIGSKPVPEEEAKKKILERYQGFLKRMKQLDGYDLLEIYLTDLTTSLDPHTTYMSPATLDDFEIAMKLNLEGIGALLRSENGKTVIAEIVPGGAAAADGRLKAGDTITAVAQDNGPYTEVLDMKLRDVVKLIRGAKGTKVRLKVTPANKLDSVEYALTRQKVELKDQAARGEILESGKKADGKPFKVGVIDLPSFYAEMGFVAGAGRGGAAKSATEDVRQLLKGFQAQGGVDAVVLDLRRNGGGSLREAQSLTGLFVGPGPVVQVKDSRGKEATLTSPERAATYTGPLVVLTGRLSASASEILAGALQDYGRALIVGDPATHGKGTVQMMLDLGDQVDEKKPPKLGALKLTIQQFYRVNGDSTQNRGVAADVVVPMITAELGTAEKDLEFALPFDQLKPVKHEQLGQVPDALKADLQGKSAARVKASAEFAKLGKELAMLKDRRAKKALPLNEKELKAQLTADEAEKGEQSDEAPEEKAHPGETYKFPKTFVSNEILNVVTDYVAGLKSVAAK